MNITDIYAAINRGELDEHLPNLSFSVNARKRLLDIQNRPTIADFHVGDEVVFNSKVSPKYLEGRKGIVTKVNRSRVKVRIGENAGRFSNSTPNCPISILDKV